MLARLTLDYQQASGGGRGSKADAELHAVADPSYEEYIVAMVAARKAAADAKMNYDAMRLHLELLRTYESTDRCAPPGSGGLCGRRPRRALRWRGCMDASRLGHRLAARRAERRLGGSGPGAPLSGGG